VPAFAGEEGPSSISHSRLVRKSWSAVSEAGHIAQLLQPVASQGRVERSTQRLGRSIGMGNLVPPCPSHQHFWMIIC